MVKAKVESPDTALANAWMLHVDGSSNIKCTGTRLILANPDSIVVENVPHFKFKTFNNKAEYDASSKAKACPGA